MSSDFIEPTFTQLVKKVEPKTRFDRSTLRIEGGHTRMVAGRASRRFIATMSNEPTEHTDRLPYGAMRLESPEQLDEAAKRVVQMAYAALPERFASWARVNAGNDHPLRPSDCFNGPQMFGWERTCRRCGGNRNVPCQPCRGKGSLPCQRCGTTGTIDCSTCKTPVIGRFLGLGRKGEIRCATCKAAGKHNGATCGACGGRGWVRCPKCLGQEKIPCPSGCTRGYHTCRPCNGSGQVPCGACAATGWLHTLRTVACSVGDHYGVYLTDSNGEVVGELQKRDLSALRAIARLVRRPANIEGNAVERVYDIECDVTEIGVRVLDKPFRFVGYSAAGQIFNYQGVVQHMLSADLDTLKKAVGATRFSLWGHPAALIEATKHFLESEVNVTLDDPSHRRDNLVDAGYVKEAKSLSARALRRLFWARFGPSLLAIVPLPSLVFVLGRNAGAWERLGAWTFVPLLLSAVAPLAFFEYRARARLIALFNAGTNATAGVGRKADSLLGRHYVLLTARLVALTLATLAGWATASAVFRTLP